jgi:hypothetical protein
MSQWLRGEDKPNCFSFFFVFIILHSAFRMIHRIQLPSWLRPKPATLAPADLEIHDSGMVFNASGGMDYFWLYLTERENGQTFTGYRIVRLLQVRAIPIEARSDAGLLQKMRAVLRGLGGARVNLAYLAAGIFGDPPLGIIQCYGVITFAEERELAVQKSLRDLTALEAALKGQYRQIRLEEPSVRIANWLYHALEHMPHALVTVGHPDPRENSRSPAHLNNPLISADPAAQGYSLQQNEILYRGMASLSEEFLLMVLAYSVPIHLIGSLLAGYAQETSIWASQQAGVRSASFGVSLPAMLSGALAESASRNYGQTSAEAHTDGISHTDGQADSTGHATTTGHTVSQGWSHSVSKGIASSEGTAISDGTAVTDGHSDTSSSSHTSGQSSSTSGGSSHSESTGWNVGATANIKEVPIIGGLLGAVGLNDPRVSVGYSSGVSDGTMSGWSEATMSSSTSGSASTDSHAETVSHGSTKSSSVTHSSSESWGTSGSVSDSIANTESQSTTLSQADTKSQASTRSMGESLSSGLGRSVSNGLSVGIAPSFSIGNAAQWQNDPAMLVTEIMRVQERLLKTASIEGAFYTDVYALARSERGLQALMGLIPESFQGTEEVVTGVQCRTLAEEEQTYIREHARAWTPSTRIETIPGAISGYMDSTLLTMLQLAAYTAPGIFEQGTATTIQEETPQFAFYPDMPGEVVLGRQFSVETGLLTHAALRLSRDRHFHTAFIGDTGFGKTVAAETLAQGSTLAWHYRTIILDFGQGWRKALNWPGLKGRVDVRQLFPGAKRPLRWNFLQVPKRIEVGRYRTLVAELFANAGQMGPRQLGFMRRALTDLYSQEGVLLSNIAAHYDQKTRPLLERIQKLRREIRPASQAVEQAIDEPGQPDLPRKQSELRDRQRQLDQALETLNTLQRRRRELLEVSGAEASWLDIPAGTSIDDLIPEQQQELSVRRSMRVSIKDWIGILREYYEEVSKKGDQASRTSLEGVLLRLEQFEEGQMLRQYGPGSDAIAIENLGLLGPEDDPWGVTVVEGGAEMDEFAKAALFSLLAAVVYGDAVVRRRESLAGVRFPPLQIFFEEANKVLSGVAGGAGSDAEKKGANVSAIWESMWRDARKYDIYLHLLAQTVSQLPPGILASCANVFVFQTKNSADRDLILPHLGKSEKGIVNTEYKRYLARIPRSYAIVKLGYSAEVLDLEPVLIRPNLLIAHESSDADILYILERRQIVSAPISNPDPDP